MAAIHVIKGLISKFRKPFGFAKSRKVEQVDLPATVASDPLSRLYSVLPEGKVSALVKFSEKSKSQLRQDLFVLSEVNFLKGGYFVEFGATNGLDLSNSHILEKEFEWQGILAEPARIWHETLVSNRTAHIETKCVWKDSHSTLIFNEATMPELSTIDSFSMSDLHNRAREDGLRYEVETISLNDLLEKFLAPTHINYMSIDTEGSELEILKSFNFSKYKIDIITVEHNYTDNRNAIFALLSQEGYLRKYEEISFFDDWYVRADLNY